MPLFFIAAAISLLLDQLSKLYIRGALNEGQQIPLIPGLMHLEYVRNPGAAWGVMSGHKWILVGFTLLVIGMIVGSAKEVARRGKLAALGFGMILGGAVGNLIDRILFGHVTDFFDLDTPISAVRNFPVFNVADSALTVGVILMLVTLLFTRPATPATPGFEAEKIK